MASPPLHCTASVKPLLSVTSLPARHTYMSSFRLYPTPQHLYLAGSSDEGRTWELIQLDRAPATPSSLTSVLQIHAGVLTEPELCARVASCEAAAARAASAAGAAAAAGQPQAGDAGAGGGGSGSSSGHPAPHPLAAALRPSGGPSALGGGLLSMFSVFSSTPVAAAAAPEGAAQGAAAAQHPAADPPTAAAPPFLSAVAFLGAVSFTRGYYLVLATRREAVGMIGAHVVYAPRGVELVPVHFEGSGARHDGSGAGSSGAGPGPAGSVSATLGAAGLSRWLQDALLSSSDPSAIAEGRYQSLFLSLDLTKDFYFSYTYDLTLPLQHQLQVHTCASGGSSSSGAPPPLPPALRERDGMFMWNSFLASQVPSVPASWMAPLIHGFFRQVTLVQLTAPVRLTLLARRSRFYAGARYLKRGASDEGHAANEVESEQIVDDTVGGLSSFLQLRASIPVHWTQRTSVAMPRPPILLQPRDVTYATARAHAANMFARYGPHPLLFLNLVKKKEPRGSAREKTVGRELARSVLVLNRELPPHLRLQYCSIDYNAVCKSTKRHNVLAALRDVARWSVANTGFFCSVPQAQARRAGGGALAGERAPAQGAFPSLGRALDDVEGGGVEGDGANPFSQLPFSRCPRASRALQAGVYITPYAVRQACGPGSAVDVAAAAAARAFQVDQGRPGDAVETAALSLPSSAPPSTYFSTLLAHSTARPIAWTVHSTPAHGEQSGGAPAHASGIGLRVQMHPSLAAAPASALGAGGGGGMGSSASPKHGVDLSLASVHGMLVEEGGSSEHSHGAAALPAGEAQGEGGAGDAAAAAAAPASALPLPLLSSAGEGQSMQGSAAAGRDGSEGRSRASSDSDSVSGASGEEGPGTPSASRSDTPSSSSSSVGHFLASEQGASAAMSHAHPEATTDKPAPAARIPTPTSFFTSTFASTPTAAAPQPARPAAVSQISSSAATASLSKLSEEDSVRPDASRHHAAEGSSHAAALAAGSSRYVVACTPASAALASRLCDVAGVGAEAEYLYMDLIGGRREGGEGQGTPSAAAAPDAASGVRFQRGILRTNCVDCLDRTNVSQVSVGAHVLGLQLHALGLTAIETLDPAGVFARTLMDLFVAHGNAIAMQYGGSEANKKVTADSHEEGVRAGDAAEGKMLLVAGAGGGGASGGGMAGIAAATSASAAAAAAASTPAALPPSATAWNTLPSLLGAHNSLASTYFANLRLSSSGPSEILTSLQRFYSNSFTDSMKQDAINIFLGVYRPRVVEALALHMGHAGPVGLVGDAGGTPHATLPAAALAPSTLPAPIPTHSMSASIMHSLSSTLSSLSRGRADPLAGAHLWDLESDYHLHHPTLLPSSFSQRLPGQYWCAPWAQHKGGGSGDWWSAPLAAYIPPFYSCLSEEGEGAGCASAAGASSALHPHRYADPHGGAVGTLTALLDSAAALAPARAGQQQVTYLDSVLHTAHLSPVQAILHPLLPAAASALKPPTGAAGGAAVLNRSHTASDLGAAAVAAVAAVATRSASFTAPQKPPLPIPPPATAPMQQQELQQQQQQQQGLVRAASFTEFSSAQSLTLFADLLGPPKTWRREAAERLGLMPVDPSPALSVLTMPLAHGVGVEEGEEAAAIADAALTGAAQSAAEGSQGVTAAGLEAASTSSPPSDAAAPPTASAAAHADATAAASAPASIRPFHSSARGSSYPSLYSPYPTPAAWSEVLGTTPGSSSSSIVSHLGILPADAALYERNAALARRVSSGGAGAEEGALPHGTDRVASAAAAADAGTVTSASQRVHLVTERADIDLFRRMVNSCASAAAVRNVEATLPVFLAPLAVGGGGLGMAGGGGSIGGSGSGSGSGSGGSSGGGGGVGTSAAAIPMEQFMTQGVPAPAPLRDMETVQAHAVRDLLSPFVPHGLFAGQQRRRQAAPLVLTAFQRAEGARERLYWEGLHGAGEEGCSHLLTAPVAMVPVMAIST